MLYDGHGSTRQLVGQDALVKANHDYDAYGVEIPVKLPGVNATNKSEAHKNKSDADLLYSGEYFDKDLKQQYLRGRYYNQNNGQFNRLDPYSGNLSDPQSLHKYAYCHQDPVNHIDPSGNFSLVEVSITTTILFSLATGLFTGFHAWLNQKTSPLVAAVLGVIAAVVTFCGLFFAVQIAAFFGTFFLFATLTQQVIMCGVLAYGVSGVVEDMFEAVKIVFTKKPIGFLRRFVAAGFVLSILGDILLGGVKSGSKGAADDILRNTLDDAAEVAIESAARNSAATKKVDGLIEVYRGVDGNHPQFQNAIKGKAEPWGGHDDVFRHNAGDNDSIFTSWTTDYDTAADFALKEGPGGVILKQKVPKDSLIKSPDVFKESEVLRKGNIKGATPVILQ